MFLMRTRLDIAFGGTSANRGTALARQYGRDMSRVLSPTNSGQQAR